jgi:RNA polymerase sigma-54 factor
LIVSQGQRHEGIAMKNGVKANLRMNMGQTQVMTPQLLQSIRLLQLTALELEMDVRQALDSNLMLESVDEELELADPEADPEAGAEAPVAGETVAESTAGGEIDTSATAAEVTGCDTAATERVEADFDWSSAESWSSGEPWDDDREPAVARIADTPARDPRMHALAQLQLVVTDRREAELVALIVDAVDDNGYLSEPLDVIAARFQGTPAPTPEEMEAALLRVQSVEPTGFAARNLRECLLLQLAALPPVTPGLRLARRIVDEHLDRLAEKNLAPLAEELDADSATLARARALIRSLDPKPGAANAVPAEAVVPDVIITGTDGAWKLELNPETLPRVRVNRYYEQEVTGNGSSAAYRALRDQLNEARWLVRGLEMRHETLIKTARVVFERQRSFLRIGEEGMVPLTLREVAEAIGMHESTVCRVVANKHVLTPWGVYALKAFFPTHITGADGDTSGTAVRAMIRKIIDAENRAHPLCDGEVAALLARRGVRVARRTVAKYRESMHIAPAAVRAQGAAGAALAH